jgi:hypothetical protein
MDSKQSIVANVHYQSCKGRGAAKLKGLLRYVQYRDDRQGHITQKADPDRWADHGLGSTFQAIASQCEAWKSEHVQAFTWVINPNPDLMALIPVGEREAVVRDLTERTVRQFFEARGLETPEYSYALHRRETTDAQQPGRENPHIHIILPGTYDSWADGARLPLYMNRNKRENHIELLHSIAQAEMAHTLERLVGPDWEQRYDALCATRQPDPEPPALRPWSGPTLDL